ncbi:MAG: PilZ domain-containing protein [Pseudomonadota bacterium]|nr:PilZ domain-containing protein [Pseudomonadota bacterium]
MAMQPVETTIYSFSDSPPRVPTEDRREGGDRLTTLYRVGSLSIAERRELCLIKNISAGGMMVRAYCAIAEGTPVSVILKCGQPIAGVVSWSRDVHLGIRFDHPIDVIDLLSTSMDGPQPRMPRIEVAAMVTLREGASTYRLRLCDISQGGLKMRCEADFAAGNDVVVTLAGIEPQPGVVRWTHGDHVGITFNCMLALPVLVEWLRWQRDSGPDSI